MKKILVTILLGVMIPVEVSAASCTTLSGNFGLGSRGPQVSMLQTYLFDTGLLSSSATGYFGNLTYSALKIYQGIKQISQTGFVGPLTRQSIQKDSCQTPVVSNPVACTMEARLCPDGTLMQRSTTTCEWQVNSCKTETIKTSPVVVATTTQTYWDPKQAKPLSEAMLTSLIAAFKSAGFNINSFATTTMSESEILEMTRKFEQDYIVGK